MQSLNKICQTHISDREEITGLIYALSVQTTRKLEKTYETNRFQALAQQAFGIVIIERSETKEVGFLPVSISQSKAQGLGRPKQNVVVLQCRRDRDGSSGNVQSLKFAGQTTRAERDVEKEFQKSLQEFTSVFGSILICIFVR